MLQFSSNMNNLSSFEIPERIDSLQHDHLSQQKVNSVEALEELIACVKAAQEHYAKFTQEQVDRIFKQAAMAANNGRIPLAKLAVEETGMGVVEDKVIKNHFASEIIDNKYRAKKTC